MIFSPEKVLSWISKSTLRSTYIHLYMYICHSWNHCHIPDIKYRHNYPGLYGSYDRNPSGRRSIPETAAAIERWGPDWGCHFGTGDAEKCSEVWGGAGFYHVRNTPVSYNRMRTVSTHCVMFGESNTDWDCIILVNRKLAWTMVKAKLWYRSSLWLLWTRCFVYRSLMCWCWYHGVYCIRDSVTAHW